MPIKYRRKKIGRPIIKRRYRNNNVLARSIPATLPDQMNMYFKYTESVIVTVTGGSAVNYQFRGNSLYDPDLTSTGHQPTGYDEWSAFYNKFTVLGSSCDVKAYITGISTALVVNGLVAVVPTVDASPTLTYANVLTLPNCKHKVFTYNTSVGHVKNRMMTNKIFGKSLQAVKDDDYYSASTTANPTNQWYWNIYINNADNSSNLSGQIVINVTYYARMTSRKLLQAS